MLADREIMIFEWCRRRGLPISFVLDGGYIGRKYALIVGIRQYDPNQLRPVPYAENDAVELAATLTDVGFRRVILLTQVEGAKEGRFLPLSKNVRASLKGVLEDREPNDLVLVCFAGHGIQFKGEPTNYFCPMDADLMDRSSLISLNEVYDQLQESKAGTKLLMVDACRNDPLAGNARDGADAKLASVTRPQLPTPPGGVAAFFSCSAGQRAFEHEKIQHGVFFHHVITGLRGDAVLKQRNEVTWDSLVAYVKSEVPDTVKDLLGDNVRQVPEQMGTLRGLAVLAIQDATGTNPGERRELAPGMKFRWCPPGKFTMGSPKTETDRRRDENQVQVTLTNGFWLGETEVTQGQWEQLMGTQPWNGKTDVITGNEYAATYVSHVDAAAYCARLTERERQADRLPAAWKYTLPTEAQWEYACREGTSTKYSFGNDDSKLGEYAWYEKNAWDSGEKNAHIVGQKNANALGAGGHAWKRMGVVCRLVR